jgi:hypothetical protein
MAHYNVERSALVNTALRIVRMQSKADRAAALLLLSQLIAFFPIGRSVTFFASGCGSIHIILKRLAYFVEEAVGIPTSYKPNQRRLVISQTRSCRLYEGNKSFSSFTLYCMLRPRCACCAGEITLLVKNGGLRRLCSHYQSSRPRSPNFSVAIYSRAVKHFHYGFLSGRGGGDDDSVDS